MDRNSILRTCRPKREKYAENERLTNLYLEYKIATNLTAKPPKMKGKNWNNVPAYLRLRDICCIYQVMFLNQGFHFSKINYQSISREQKAIMDDKRRLENEQELLCQSKE